MKQRNLEKPNISIRKSNTPEKKVFGTFENTFEFFNAAESLNLQRSSRKYIKQQKKISISIVNKT